MNLSSVKELGLVSEKPKKYQKRACQRERISYNPRGGHCARGGSTPPSSTIYKILL